MRKMIRIILKSNEKCQKVYNANDSWALLVLLYGYSQAGFTQHDLYCLFFKSPKVLNFYLLI